MFVGMRVLRVRDSYFFGAGRTSSNLSPLSECLLFPQKRTFADAIVMSAECQFQTLISRQPANPFGRLDQTARTDRGAWPTPVNSATFLRCATAADAPIVLVSRSRVISSSSATGISD